ncbi:universal stress protein [uncultured Desulfosarcina sp.]|uniref:universal stress protein n=1 Tax=uncultured Desulfosarcina sp. TaxID=218289 RepID=UPI0029C8AE9B|nr:universal stress protein [uncultured Desulfosarcina sp.]
MPLRVQAIVCAVDFSPFSSLVVSRAVALARRAGLRLYLIHAVHHPQDGVHPTAAFERGGDLSRHTDAARRKIADLMARAPVSWEAVVRFGEPVEQMTAFLDSLPPALVVSASHGVTGFRRLFIGTVVERLTRQLDCPMLVVKPADAEDRQRTEGIRQAVVSCDGHGYWQRLGPLLEMVQSDSGAKVHLVHALESPVAMPPEADGDAASYGESQQAQNLRLQRQLQKQAQQWFPHVDAVDVTVEPGVPQEMVMRVARQQAADLIVVGVHRSTKVGRWISGSTTETLLRQAPCCVMTVPEPATDSHQKGNRR